MKLGEFLLKRVHKKHIRNNAPRRGFWISSCPIAQVMLNCYILLSNAGVFEKQSEGGLKVCFVYVGCIVLECLLNIQCVGFKKSSNTGNDFTEKEITAEGSPIGDDVPHSEKKYLY